MLVSVGKLLAISPCKRNYPNDQVIAQRPIPEQVLAMMKAVELDALVGARPTSNASLSDEGKPVFGDVLQQEARQMAPAESGAAETGGIPEDSVEPAGRVRLEAERSNGISMPEESRSPEQLMPGDESSTTPPVTTSTALAEIPGGGNLWSSGGMNLPSELSLDPVSMQSADATILDVNIEPLLANESGITVSMVLDQVKQNPTAGAGVQMTAANAHQTGHLPGSVMSQLSGEMGIGSVSRQEGQASASVVALDELSSISRITAGTAQINTVIDPRRQFASFNADGSIQPGMRTGAIESGPIEIGRISALLPAGKETIMANLVNTEMQAVTQARLDAQPNLAQGAGSLLAGEQTLPDLRSATMALTGSAPQSALPGTEQSSLRPTHSMMTPAQQSGWDNEFGNRINYMIKHDQQVAELRLNPASLGVVEVRISTENDKAEVSFFAQNAATREMLEAALPRLRETLAANGVVLEQALVSEDAMPDRQSDQSREGNGLAAGDGTTGETSESESGTLSRVISTDTLVDTFI